MVTGKMPDLDQRLRTVTLLGLVWSGLSQTVLRKVLHKALSMHPNWKNLKSRPGMFNKSAQVEVLYALMQGIHHSLAALGFMLSRKLREKSENRKEGEEEPTIGPFNWKGLALYSGFAEYAYEWSDFIMMITQRWPYEDRNPKFMFLLTAHHLFGMLSFFLSGSPKGLNKNATFMAEKVLGVAGIGLVLYPLQQLSDLQTKSGLRNALTISVTGLLMTLYGRFYVFPKYGMQFLREEGFLEKKDDGSIKKSTVLLHAAGGMLSIFNVLVLLGQFEKTLKYNNMLKLLSSKQ